MDDIEELEKLRGQPMDVLIEYDQGERGDAWDRANTALATMIAITWRPGQSSLRATIPRIGA